MKPFVLALVTVLSLAVINVAPAGSLAEAAKVLYQADLSKREGGWPSENTRSDSVGYVAGGYRIQLIKRSNGSFPTPSVEIGATVRSLRVQTDATELTASGAHVFGVGCLSQGGTSGYVMGASPDNGYATVIKLTRNGGIQFLKQGGRRLTVSRTHVRLQAHCIGAQPSQPTRLALDLNGKRIISVTDRRGLKTFDHAGLFALSEGGVLSVVFHHIMAQQP